MLLPPRPKRSTDAVKSCTFARSIRCPFAPSWQVRDR
jgi:hypothetical protein